MTPLPDPTLPSSEQPFLATYGTLLRGQGIQERFNLHRVLEFVSPCEIPGTLYDFGSYPGLVLEAGSVKGELYRVKDSSLFALLDRYEGYDPSDIEHSLYVRRAIPLTTPQVTSWVYVYNRPVTNGEKIEHGDWIRHITPNSDP